MLVLQQLVESKSLTAGDKLYFAFKDFNFQCRVSEAGLLFECTFSSCSMEQEPCFLDRGGFSSLTDWADCCLQDLAGEYVTRFSSWKRIRHVKTNRLLSEIRDMQRELKTADDCPIYIHLQKQLLLYQQQLQELRKRMLHWKEWIEKQSDVPVDLQGFLKRATEFTGGELYVMSDMATLKQLLSGVNGSATKKRKRRVIKKTITKIANPIAAAICSDDVNDEEYQEMLAEFFKNVSK